MVEILDVRDSSKEPFLPYTTPLGVRFHTTHFLLIGQPFDSLA